MKKILMTVIASSALLMACASNSDPYFKTKIASANEVAGCRFIGNLSSSSQNYGLFTETANKNRLQNAKRSGYNLGASHIVLDPPIENGGATMTNGKAYSCQ